jgi:1-phosphatidylinositol-4-phosphate 5-kinase
MLDAASQLPNEDSADRRHFLFYQDEGGLRATDEQNQSMDVIYYLGVIDICTPYNTAKKIEHFWKSMTEDRVSPSWRDVTPPDDQVLTLGLAHDLMYRPEPLWPAIPQLHDVGDARW